MSTREVVAADTTAHAHAQLMAKFAAMSMSERAKVADDLTASCTTLAIAGIHAAHGDLSDNEVRYHLALRRYGRALADEVYGQSASP